MAMTVRELAKWLSEFHDQDALVEVVEYTESRGTFDVSDRLIDVDANVEYADFRQLDPEKYAIAGKSFLTLGRRVL